MSVSVYHKAAGKYNPEPESPAIEDAQLTQLKHDWLTNPITAAMFKNIGIEVSSLMEQAISLAVSYPQHNNHQQIVEKLVRINELRKIKETYGK